ncbi:leucyl aminopeptidase family protein [Erythrobacteraceae bacterium CFH 75059]|uniref:leucyl aminopeptidase family protein n=1 Tax=Qipengyuania thermophila TaxID=2509361 RepID=UPI001020CFD9|nr:leucyl aminopeptidase family protein [Qipengyuania thermophila]TCD06196.1 leucyl aminopeptidase family protein [Erythrobacteraceae bacterium CFH 75059]
MAAEETLIRADRGEAATAIHLVSTDSFAAWSRDLSAAQRALLEAQRFTGAGFQTAIVPDQHGWFAVGGVADPASLSSWCLARLAEVLPAGVYRLVTGDAGAAALGWQLAQYRFTRYARAEDAPGPRILLVRDAARVEAMRAEADAVTLVRDLVNTPAEDMGPAQLEDAVQQVARRHGAALTVIRGDALARDYPLIHAVGRAAARSHAPRLLHMVWGGEGDPVLALVGKGVCFDTGGLDIKPSAGMALMKKDMGGAAHMLALARLVMDAALPVRLHLLIPAVENAIAGNSFRPGDVLQSRRGLSVEVTNTDAEGRLILADALTRACEEKPDLVIDFATLTGAARVALGPELPAIMARRDGTADAMLAAGKRCDDEVWRLPLHEPYGDWLKSPVADLVNAHGNAFAGATVAGLFLDRFVEPDVDWLHCDTFAWRADARPGRPKGGEALGLRAAFTMLRQRYGRG